MPPSGVMLLFSIRDSTVDHEMDADLGIWPEVASRHENAGHAARFCDKVGSEESFCYTWLIPL